MRIAIGVLLLLLPTSVHAALDALEASRAFDEMTAMCRADAKRLWGVELCGPLLLVEPATREVIANHASPSLQKVDGLWIGKLPQSVGIANTATEWDGIRWTMLMAPLPKDETARRALLAHESFHRVQRELGFPSTGPANAHLDTRDGRYLLRLELRALAAALQSGRAAHVADAALFRARRRELFAKARDEERQLEMHEGLAQYTGAALALPKAKARARWLAKQLRADEAKESFVRTFAYSTTPAWGALLDLHGGAGWTRRVTANDDVADLVVAKLALALPRDVTARAATYDGAALLAYEQDRERKQQALLAALRTRFVDGPILILPLGQMQLDFDPNGLQPLPGVGTVYRKITVRSAWGSIAATNGALITEDWQRMIVPLPSEANGWTLTLAEGWATKRGAREGDMAVGRNDER